MKINRKIQVVLQILTGNSEVRFLSFCLKRTQIVDTKLQKPGGLQQLCFAEELVLSDCNTVVSVRFGFSV